MPFSMVVAKPLKIQPNVNLYYDSGWKKGPDDVRTTIHSDLGSFLYELWVILISAVPQLPNALWMRMFGDKSFSGKIA
jgi:hypothetical protein